MQKKDTSVATFLLELPELSKLIAQHVDTLTDEALIKIVRQLEFWQMEGLSEQELMEITSTLIPSKDFVVPTVRFGKTEIKMPIVTCGGMRFQYTWLPDYLPIAPKKDRVLKGASQANLKASIQLCLKRGINHFETARFYGTSEYQFAHALHELIESGEIKRKDFILQTKVPVKATRKEFEEAFAQSWAVFGEKLGYIDLFSFHGISSKQNIQWLLSDADDMCMAAIQQYKKEGKVKHIGFSTHGTAENILTLINSEKFEYINIHCHYFGDYHAEGTSNGLGGHGNKAAVQRALELDMGVFNISPMDKGGMQYAPSKSVARLIGPKMSPMNFVALHAWKTRGMHTVSVGFARPSDLDDILVAAEMFAKGGYEDELKAAEDRLEKHMEEKLGTEWKSKGMINLPDCEKECTNGVALGHVLWCHNLMSAFGMYEFSRARYANLEITKWDAKKSFDKNRVTMNEFNMGRAHIPDTDYTKALENHYNPDLVKHKMKEAHEWLTSKKALMTDIERKECGWDVAYDLRVWECFPGETPTFFGVLLHSFTFGLLGGHGPTRASNKLAKEIRSTLVS